MLTRAVRPQPLRELLGVTNLDDRTEKYETENEGFACQRGPATV